jgi:hypothetical protein
MVIMLRGIAQYLKRLALAHLKNNNADTVTIVNSKSMGDLIKECFKLNLPNNK